MSIIIQERSIVIPGEALAEGMDFLPGDNTYRESDKIYAKILGMVTIAGRVLKITPLAGPYVPRAGDKIIGTVMDITMTGWRISTSTAYTAMLNVRDATSHFVGKDEDLSKIMAIGDSVIVKIVNVTSQNLIDVTMKEPGLRKISGGRIIKINSQKVPRVIGKQGSMISLIKSKTGCDITVGQNGLVWIKGTPEGESLAEEAVRMIENKSHHSGLTEKMEAFLKESGIDLGDVASAPANVPNEGTSDNTNEQF
ncbi:RNA-binding protein [Candidatus Woesearchaeota archaeon]|nr:RNA-binding protein [Candidatus Woesearchaeota archaeon]